MTRQIVSECGCAHFGDGQPAGRDDQRGREKLGRLGASDELRCSLNFMDSAVEKNLHAGGAAFCFQHVRDVFRGAIAEKLAQGLLVVGDAMFFNQSGEIGGRVTGEGGFRKVFVCGEEVFRPAMQVGEIAPASAGDQDFLADAVGALQHRDTAPAFAGFYGAEQTRGPCAKNQSVKLMHQGKLSSDRGRPFAGFRCGSP